MNRCGDKRGRCGGPVATGADVVAGGDVLGALLGRALLGAVAARESGALVVRPFDAVVGSFATECAGDARGVVPLLRHALGEHNGRR